MRVGDFVYQRGVRAMRGKICWVLPLLLASTGVAMADTDVTVYGYLDLSVDLGDQLWYGTRPGPSGSGTLGRGGPIATTGASGFGECNDGEFGDAYSGDVVFKSGGLLAIAAGELHHAVIRNGNNIPGVFTSGS